MASNTAAAAPPASTLAPSVAYRNYVLFVLVVVNTVNFIDRTAISVLARPIQQEFGVNDALIGLVMGIAFTAFYATLGFPIARLLDKRKRTTILAGVLALWSGMTALCGAAASFLQLFLFRVGVGVGEAGAGPASHSLIGDYFRKVDRPMAIGFFSLGVPLGNFFGIVVGGLLVGMIGWRWTFVALGLPGIVLALIVWLTVREPVRGAMDDAADAAALRAADDIPLWEGIKNLWASPTFRIMSLSAAPSALCGYGMNLWMPQFLTRVHELTSAALSLPLGTAIGVGGGLGAMLGGVITGRAAARDPRAFLTLPALTMLIFAVAMAFAIWTTSLVVVYSAIFVAAFCQFYLMGPFFAVVQRLAPLRGRAVATAFFFFILATVGLGIGPAYVGGMSSLFQSAFSEAEGLRYAMATLSLISLLAAAVAWFGRRAIDRDIDKIGGVSVGA
jgi:MFS transporter, Spinster family, sphingosine-1-phosphate transporter